MVHYRTLVAINAKRRPGLETTFSVSADDARKVFFHIFVACIDCGAAVMIPNPSISDIITTRLGVSAELCTLVVT